MPGISTRIKWLLFLFFDIAALAFSIIFAFVLRLGWPIYPEYIPFLRVYLVPLIVVKLAIFYGFGLYRRFWRYASIHELRVIIQAVIISSFSILFLSYSLGTTQIPRSVFVVDGLLTMIMVGGIRFAGRTLSEFKLYARAPEGVHRVLIVGAGDAGEMLAREMLKNSSLGYLPIGFVDDDLQKRRMQVHGIKVLGTRNELKTIVESNLVSEVIIAMPSVSRQVKEEIVSTCKQAGVKCRTLPGIYEMIDGRVGVGQIRDVQIEDILGRDPVKVNLSEIAAFVAGRKILVTGAGGSIGSELCRQVSHFKPSLLILVDIAENSLFEIEQELLEKDLCPLIAVLGDVKDAGRMDEVLGAHRPQVIFHAAAYKHVPLMEMNPRAALENNFLGTMELAQAALRRGVEKFVLISTDKAVRPKNIMGFSKALAEKFVSCLPSDLTQFVVVRFGNVLASNGSVVPIFQKQIAAGGPITVTHPEMKRYLMTITESVQLVLQAAAFGGAGDLFLLDMGDQVPIVELAEKLITLSGYRAEEMPIKYIGVRPGEKIEEELIAPTEMRTSSPHSKIFKLRDDSSNKPALMKELRGLEGLIREDKLSVALAKMRSLLEQPELADASGPAQKLASLAERRNASG